MPNKMHNFQLTEDDTQFICTVLTSVDIDNLLLPVKDNVDPIALAELSAKWVKDLDRIKNLFAESKDAHKSRYAGFRAEE